MGRLFWIMAIAFFILSGPLYSVTVTSPKAGDTWHTGYYQTIAWDSPRNSFDRVKIYLLSAEPNETVETWDLAEDTGSFRWNLLRSFHPGSFKIRIRIGNESAESGPFEIKESFIRVTYPTEMTTVTGPQTVRITWDSSEEMKTVRITKIYNSQEIGSDVIENLHHYDFVIDNIMRGAMRFKIANGNIFTHCDYSETILIRQPSLVVKAPTAASSYFLGQTIGISWETKNFDKLVRVELWDSIEERLIGTITDKTDAEFLSWNPLTPEGKSMDCETLLAAHLTIKVAALNVPDLYARSAGFTIQPPLIDDIVELYRPGQGDTWIMGNAKTIDWHIRDDRFADEEMAISLCRDETPLTTIATIPLSERSLSWTIPHGLAEGSRYRIKTELPRFGISNFSKYFIILGDYCTSEKVSVHSITLDKKEYLFDEDIVMRVELANPSQDAVSGTLRLYVKKDAKELGQYLGETEITMGPEERVELPPITFRADMLFNSPGKYSRQFQPKIIPKNLAFLTCDCIGKSFVIDATRQIPCGIQLIDFSVDKTRYYENETLEYSFTLYNRSEHPFNGDVTVTGSSGFKDARLHTAKGIRLEQGQRKQITGSLPVKDIADMEGKYELKLKGEFFSSDAIFSSGAYEIRRGAKIEVLPLLDSYDLQRSDLTLGRCRFIRKSEFQGGDKAEIYVAVKNNGNVTQREYQITAWNVVGEPQKTTGLTPIRPQERGRVSFKKTFKKTLLPGKTFSHTLEITLQDRKSGTYTLYLEVTPIDPQKENKPIDNRKSLVYKYQAVFQIKK